MNVSDRRVAPARDVVAASLFAILNLVLFPVTVVGYLLALANIFLPGGKSGVSRMAQRQLVTRWLMHNLGTRPDEPSNRLFRVLPGVSPLSWRLVASPTLLAHRLSGYVPKSLTYPFEGETTIGTEDRARQTFFDSVLDRNLPNIAQFVVLGAGFDTRAFRLPRDARIRSFEIDTPQTMAARREMVERAGIDSTGVTFVAADFEREDWLTKLVGAGFDPGKPALFIWEGVIMYLDKEAVETTLRRIASTAKGSVIAFDYFTTEILESPALYMRTVRASLKSFGAPLKFGVDSTPPSGEQLAEILRSCGLSMGEQRTLGQETAGKRAWGGFAIAMVN